MAFFERAEIPNEINETLVTLIPKVPHPESINQFRPISCCTFLYKVISKIFVARLKDAMPDLISPMQSGFIQGRQIQDNLLIVQEAFHAINRPGALGRNHSIIKLDMNKAYDRVEWKFLESSLLAFGFSTNWVKMIMILVSGVSYNYKINGVVGPKLLPQRGLRQGDPFSPYLFLFTMEVLSLLIQNSFNMGNLQGLRLAPTSPALTHLLFADDPILFTKAENHEMYELKRILNIFSKASGQRVNLHKSGLIGGRSLANDKKSTLASILGLQVWSNPGLYLGMPAEWGRSKSHSLQWIKDRILSKIKGWKGVLLNQAGKEILIKAVLQAIPRYAMAILRFPKNFCKQICSKVAQFWWKGQKERGIH